MVRPLLVTGGAGFIGRSLVPRIAAGGRPVVVLDALTYAAHPIGLAAACADLPVTVVRGDVADQGVVADLIERHDVSAVVHLAAETHVDRSLQDAAPFLRTNVQGTWQVVQACVTHRVRLLQVSSDEVYGDREGGPPSAEGDPVSPTNPYAAAKACADHLVLAAVRADGLDAVITRGTNTYGPGQFPEKLLPLAARRWLAAQAMGVYGDGDQVRQWLHVDDHAAGIEAALDRGDAGAIVHLAGAPRTNRQILHQWAEALGLPGPLRRIADRPGHDRRYALDDAASREALSWAPRVALGPGLAAMARWTREHGDFWDEAMARGDVAAWFARQYGTP